MSNVKAYGAVAGIVSMIAVISALTFSQMSSVETVASQHAGGGISSMTEDELTHAVGRNWGNCWYVSTYNCLATVPESTCSWGNMTGCSGTDYEADPAPSPYKFCYNNGSSSQQCSEASTDCTEVNLYGCSFDDNGICNGDHDKFLYAYGTGSSTMLTTPEVNDANHGGNSNGC